MSLAWTLIEGPLIVLGLGVVLTIAAVAVLWEYRKLFFIDPRGVMSAEVLIQLLTQCGGPGYVGAFLLAAALLSFASGAFTLLRNVASYING
jgi:hypothetical protein